MSPPAAPGTELFVILDKAFINLVEPAVLLAMPGTGEALTYFVLPVTVTGEIKGCQSHGLWQPTSMYGPWGRQALPLPWGIQHPLL